MTTAMLSDGPAEQPDDAQAQEQIEIPGTENTLMFGKQGLSRMCDFVPFSELKILRLVCHTWNAVCSTHPRFHQAHGKFGVGWDRNSDGLQQTQLRTWRKVTLSHFAVHQSRLFRTYFACTSPNLGMLILDQVKVSCTQLSQILNSCLTLEKITFFKVAFTRQDVVLENNANNPPAQQDPMDHGQPANDVRQPRYSICCPHTKFESKDPQPVPTIKSIRITKQSSFPLCVLDILAERSAGILENLTLEFIDTPIRAIQRHMHMQVEMIHEAQPNMAQMQPYIRQICVDSSNTLKSFKWSHNGILRNQTQILALHFPALEKFSFAETWGRADDLRVPIFNFLHQTLQLVELDLSCRYTLQLRNELLNLLPTMTLLRKVRLEVDMHDGHANDLNIFANIAQLVEIQISDHNMGGNFNFHHGGGFNADYLLHLPLNIRKLTCDHRIDRDQFTASLLHPTYFLMTKLSLKCGRLVTDQIMQLIIIHVTQLQQLAIINGDQLTDAGVTGLNLASCRQMNRCHSQALLLKPPRQTTQIRRSIEEFMYMRELDFSGCSKLSDISICYGVRYPELKKVTLDGCNVSDISLVSLATHNPKLENLNIKRNRRISSSGLNRMIEISKSLRCVQTTQIIASRLKTSELSGQREHAHFRDIVKTVPSQSQDE